MRYVTSDVQQDYVPLEKEINCIRDYIELQKLRLSPETVTVKTEISGDTNLKMIAPLVFLPFVENAFKYGISNNTESPVIISIVIQDDRIIFAAKNRIFLQKNTEGTGVGIENVKRRLNHLYPGRYQLNIIQEDNTFSVKLVIET
jgi:two-component system, LytTR family, sensor kinase